MAIPFHPASIRLVFIPRPVSILVDGIRSFMGRGTNWATSKFGRHVGGRSDGWNSLISDYFGTAVWVALTW